MIEIPISQKNNKHVTLEHYTTVITVEGDDVEVEAYFEVDTRTAPATETSPEDRITVTLVAVLFQPRPRDKAGPWPTPLNVRPMISSAAADEMEEVYYEHTFC